MHSQRVGEMIWKAYDCELVVEDLKKKHPRTRLANDMKNEI